MIDKLPDWISAVAAALALLLSIISLGWQWWTQRSAREHRIRVDATARNANVWTAELTYDASERSSALFAEVRVIDWNGDRLVYDDDGPPSWLVVNMKTFDTEKRTDWSDVRADIDQHMVSIRSEMSFDLPPSALARSYFWVVPTGDHCRVEVRIVQAGSGRVLCKRRLSISPV